MAKEPTVPKDIAALSFEDALKELEGIVQQLERGQVKLDEAITAYERGALLKKHCEQKLAEAPVIHVPAITIGSDFDGAAADGSRYANKFSGKYAHRVLRDIGHNVPQEAPRAFVDAVIDADRL